MNATTSKPRRVFSPLSKEERSKRHAAMFDLVVSGFNERTIVQLWRGKYGAGEPLSSIRRLIERVREELLELSKSNREVERQKAIQRLTRRINKADVAGKFGAANNAEKLLAEIQGTLEPVHVRVDVVATVKGAIEQVVGGYTPEQLSAILAGELPATASSPPVLQAHGEEVLASSASEEP